MIIACCCHSRARIGKAHCNKLAACRPRQSREAALAVLSQGKGQQVRARLINYADDFVILSAGRAARALQWTSKVMAALKLSLNHAKTSIKDGRRERFEFLGYSFGPEQLRPPCSGW